MYVLVWEQHVTIQFDRPKARFLPVCMLLKRVTQSSSVM